MHYRPQGTLLADAVWDTAGRLRSIVNSAGTVPLTAHAYTYDALNRRPQAAREDGSLWKYGYNDRDEVTSGKHFWSDWSPVSGQQFTYAYDNIGNRSSAASGGDTGGANLRTSTYGANGLNQYTNVTTAGYEDILGVAIATNSVTVDGNACDRKGEYFHREISVSNSSNPLWQTTTVSCGGALPRRLALWTRHHTQCAS
jgi:hypothetical protein